MRTIGFMFSRFCKPTLMEAGFLSGGFTEASQHWPMGQVVNVS